MASRHMRTAWPISQYAPPYEHVTEEFIWLDGHPRMARIVAQHLAERALYLLSLVDEGLIQVERHQIQILNLQGLEAKAMLDG